MDAERDRIALIVANISTGWSQNICPSFVRAAQTENKSLFVFPGGRLNAPMESEYLRNRIYSLVNTDNLDALVCWSGSIRYKESDEVFEQFHLDFAPLPLVTLSYKIPGYPSVSFDSYTGMKLLIAHSINVHNARKIAFLRAPEFHPHAQARLKGYQDALKEAGIPFSPDNPLLTEPFNWEDGAAAAAQLFEERKLIPGKDFDTLVGCSDVMILMAMQYFSKQGYHVPRDYHALGFNNTAESRITKCSLSTVNAPFSDLGTESFRIISELLRDKKNGVNNSPINDVFLLSEPVIRESCGCAYFRYLPTGSPDLEADKSELFNAMDLQDRAELLTKMIAGFLKLGDRETRAFVAPLSRTLFKISPPDNSQDLSPVFIETFFYHLEKALSLFFETYKDTELLLKLLKDISSSGLVPFSLFTRLEPAVLRAIFKVRERYAVYTQYERESRNAAMNSLKGELLETRDRNYLLQSLARYLPKVGINTAGLVLNADAENSLWVGSFSPEGMSPVKECYFPSKLLTPLDLKHQFSRGIFMVQPLSIENHSLGYFIHSISDSDVMLFEELRSVISYVLKGILLFEEAALAKQKMQESDEQRQIMRLQKEAAQAASEVKSQFLAKMSHEIRTPMNAVLGMSELLLSENLSERQKKYADDIKTSAMALLDIINEILDISKIQSGNMSLVPIHYDFRALLDNICSIVHFLIKEKNIAFNADIKDDIPVCLYGDDVKLRQILLNILSNAVKFTKAGYVHLSVDVTNEKLRFTVKDTGRGIHEKDIPNLFEAFKQFDVERNRDVKGVGLGLSISKAFVEMMDGHVEAESVYGEGTTLTVVIPKVLGDKTKILHSVCTEKVVCSPDTKILVVDDNDINLNVIRGLLQLCYITPFTVTSGQQAIELIQQERFDVVFMDHMMPEMDGVEAVKIIRDMGISVPIIALTANAVTSAKEMLLGAGMDDFLAKPIIKEALNKILLKWVPTSRLIHEHPIESTDDNTGPEGHNELWEKIRKIEGLSVKTGLERVSGQMNVYEKTLKLLPGGIEKCIVNLDNFLAANDMHNFSIEAHSIKTSLANLGAMELSAKAHELENSSARNDAGFCASALQLFSEALHKLGNELENAFSEHQQNKDFIIPPELVLILTRMKDAFLRMEFVEINNELHNLETISLCDTLEREIEEIKDAVMVMDYSGATEMIQKLLHDT